MAGFVPPGTSRHMKLALSMSLCACTAVGGHAMGRPAQCDAPATRAAVSEQFYTNTMNVMRSQLAARFADPYAGSSSDYMKGIIAARSRLQEAVTMTTIVDHGLARQTNGRACSAKLVINGVEYFPVSSRYVVTEAGSGETVVEGEYILPGHGDWASEFNVAHAIFKRLYFVAFSETQGAPGLSAQATLAENRLAMTRAYAELLSALPDADRKAMGEDQSEWASEVRLKCGEDKPLCEADATQARTVMLVQSRELRVATEALGRAYSEALRRRDEPGKALLKQEQEAWRVAREKCSGPQLLRCVTDMTAKRTEELRTQR